MGHARLMARVLGSAFPERCPQSIIEWGAGDGTLLLRLAQHIGPRWTPRRVVLVDRQLLLNGGTREDLEALSWHVEAVEMDVFDWLDRPSTERSNVIMATLFLHHFSEDDLRRLLRHAAAQTDLFLACEPHRDLVSLGAASLLSLIGCNDVTRHDARISVRAGFAGKELSALWPAVAGWRLSERRAGGFSHCFVAERIGAVGT
jgi:hypothetical protein